MTVIRVFPRKTNATPDDDNVRFDAPGLYDGDVARVDVSCTFTWDKPRAEELADSWRSRCSDVGIGGPAYAARGGEFTPGLYVKHGYTITSRGCPNECWFCSVHAREGGLRELEIKDGYNVFDSNLLACSDEHIKKVFAMLSRQSESPRFTGGIEAALMKPWIAEGIYGLKPGAVFFAYDEPSDWEPLVTAVNMLKICGPVSRSVYRCYVLVGYKGDAIDKAESRLRAVMAIGLMPMAMLFNRNPDKIWRRFQREWANPVIIGSKYNDKN